MRSEAKSMSIPVRKRAAQNGRTGKAEKSSKPSAIDRSPTIGRVETARSTPQPPRLKAVPSPMTPTETRQARSSAVAPIAVFPTARSSARNLSKRDLANPNVSGRDRASRDRANRNSVVRQLPRRSLPWWLQVLIRFQRSSVVVMFVSVAIALMLYGGTVYTQQLWGKEYRKLQTLQRNERQLVTSSEMLKNELAQQAERPGSGLIPRTSSSMVFVQAAPPRPATPQPNASPQPSPTPTGPLGY